MIRAHDLGVKGENEIVNRLNELSLDGVQLVLYKSIDGVAYKQGAVSEDMAAKIGNTLKEAGKEIALIGAYFNPVHPDVQKSKKGKEIFRDYLSLARLLGCDTVGSETGSYMGDPWGYHPDNRTLQARKIVADTFRMLADYAKEQGACVGIEGAFNHVCYTPEVLSEVIDEIGRDNVRVIFDLYNYLDISNYTDAYAILERGHRLFGDGILLYHLKDFTVEDGALRQCGVGRGILDYEKLLGEIYRYNRNAVLVLEGTVGDDIPIAVKHIKDIIARLK